MSNIARDLLFGSVRGRGRSPVGSDRQDIESNDGPVSLPFGAGDKAGIRLFDDALLACVGVVNHKPLFFAKQQADVANAVGLVLVASAHRAEDAHRGELPGGALGLGKRQQSNAKATARALVFFELQLASGSGSE